MKAAAFAYSRPASIEEACALLAADDGARLIAGGQTLVPLMAMRLARPTRLVDIARVSGLAYVRDDLMGCEMNAFDAALALLALAKLDAGPEALAPALGCIARDFGEGRHGAPFKAYEWNKMKIPTRILVGGPEVTSAFVLSALVHARSAMQPGSSAS